MKATVTVAGLALLLVCLACDKELTDPGNQPNEETIETFLANLAKVYSEMDSTGYVAYLDPSYTFEFLPQEIEPGDPEPWFDREEELAVTGILFGQRYGAGGVKAQWIALDLLLRSAEEDTTHYPGKPDGETWYKASAYTDLKLVVADPSAVDGTGITNYLVEGEQDFILRRDPGGSGRFLVWKQIDREPPKKVSSGWATEDATWGKIKKLFFPYPESFPAFAQNFAREYSERDSIGYDAYLDSSYRFELLPDEVDPGDPNPWWDRSEELRVAGRMFGEASVPPGIRVRSIDLGLDVKTTGVDNTNYPGKPAGETWYQAVTAVDLVVVVEDPDVPDGGGIINYIVRSDQIFVLRRDPGGSGRWLVWRQIDQSPSWKTGIASCATERDSWSGVKKLFR